MITIDCDTQAGQTINVVTGDIVTVIGANMGLPEWFLNNIGSVPGYGKWIIECVDGQIIISNSIPTYTMIYDHIGGIGTGIVYVAKNICPINIHLPKSVRAGYRLVGWAINGIVYTDTYEINSDIQGIAVWDVI